MLVPLLVADATVSGRTVCLERAELKKIATEIVDENGSFFFQRKETATVHL